MQRKLPVARLLSAIADVVLRLAALWLAGPGVKVGDFNVQRLAFQLTLFMDARAVLDNDDLGRGRYRCRLRGGCRDVLRTDACTD